MRGQYGHVLALDGDVAGEARQVRLPRHRREAREVGDRGDVGVARHLADLAGGEPGEPGAVVDEVVEVARAGTSFALGRAYMSTNCAKKNSMPRAWTPCGCPRRWARRRSRWPCNSSFGDAGLTITAVSASARWRASYTARGRVCVRSRGRRAPAWRLHQLHGDLDHEPVVLAEVEAGELADAAQPLAQRVRVDVERLGGGADVAAAAQELLERLEERGRRAARSYSAMRATASTWRRARRRRTAMRRRYL